MAKAKTKKRNKKGWLIALAVIALIVIAVIAVIGGVVIFILKKKKVF